MDVCGRILAGGREGEDEEEDDEEEGMLDRLAKSEEVVENVTIVGNGNETAVLDDSEIDGHNGALVNLLSARELANVVWSLTIHDDEGNHTKLQNSTLVSAISEQIKILLDDDLLTLNRSMDEDGEIMGDDHVTDDETMTEGGVENIENDVEVVDAASLLSGSEVQTEVLSSKTTQTKAHPDLNVALDTEVPVETTNQTRTLNETNAQSTSLDSTNSVNFEETLKKKEVSSPPPSTSTTSSSTSKTTSVALLPHKLHFTTRDMCSILYALTELDHHSTVTITSKVISVCAKTNPYSEMEGKDLCNLAWAVAKCGVSLLEDHVIATTEHDDTDRVCNHVNSVMYHIATLSLRLLKSCKDTNPPFEPLELTRLLWSFRLFVTEMGRGDLDQMTEMKEVLNNFSFEVMKLMEGSIHSFSSGELAVIIWSFTELYDLNQPLPTGIIRILGRVRANLELSLLHYQNDRKTLTLADHDDKHVRLSTDSDEFAPTMPLINNTSAAPPLTLSSSCQFVYALSRLERSHTHLKGVSNALLSRLTNSFPSKLMPFSDVRDLVRLCHACAVANKGGDAAASSSLRGFVRRFVQFLNDKASEHIINDISPHDYACLLWSLGELGVVGDEGVTSSRKVHLKIKKPNIESDRLITLPSLVLIDLLKGAVQLCDSSQDTFFLQNILSEVHRRIHDSTFSPTPAQSYQVTMILIDVLQIYTDLERKTIPEISVPTAISNNPNETTTSQTTSPLNDAHATPANPPEADDTISPEDRIIDSLLSPSPSQQPNNHEQITTLTNLCQSLLHNMTSTILPSQVKQFNALQIRHILESYLATRPYPLNDETLLSAIQIQVKKRMQALALASSTTVGGTSVRELIQSAADSSVDALAKLSEIDIPLPKEEQKQELDNKDANDTNERKETVIEYVNRAAASSCEAAARVARVARGTSTGTTTEDVLQAVEEKAMFELGQCEEILELLRTGGGNVNGNQKEKKMKREGLGTRILSRLFQ
eukprot:CAMPEP_0172484530 /NCGR_PEP_ID=MMETSP1066-20121228/12023_1 /TAXON_ID=671091 /ORGANISM="Coscinodiscus wailesii, Strain CCMP2513" /LENGTH=993 /DNA_ID=CAMNT_0013249127 /DNA_START=1 /DNA_END=2982 /DNA_ORIENTATION=+